jgi:hypothetical protein
MKHAILFVGKACGEERLTLSLLDVVGASLVASPPRGVARIFALTKLRRENSPFARTQHGLEERRNMWIYAWGNLTGQRLGRLVSNTRRDEGIDSEIKMSSNGRNSKLTSSRSESKFSLSEEYCGAKRSGTGDRTRLGGFTGGSIRASGDDVSLESSLTISMARTR